MLAHCGLSIRLDMIECCLHCYTWPRIITVFLALEMKSSNALLGSRAKLPTKSWQRNALGTGTTEFSSIRGPPQCIPKPHPCCGCKAGQYIYGVKSLGSSQCFEEGPFEVGVFCLCVCVCVPYARAHTHTHIYI